ncbi:MAG: ATP-binding protein [Terriglobia bacterium]
MRKRLLYGLFAILLIVLAILPFSSGGLQLDPAQTFVFFGLSLLIFLLMVTLGFMLVRFIVKLWVERRSDRFGSRIRTKLFAGALALSIMPVVFMVLFNYYVMNATLARWFTQPRENAMQDSILISTAIERQTTGKALAEAQLLASLPETQAQLMNSAADTAWLNRFCRQRSIDSAWILPSKSMQPVARFGKMPFDATAYGVAAAPILLNGVPAGTVFVHEAVPIDVAAQVRDIEEEVRHFQQLREHQRHIRTFYLQVLILIAIFVLYVAGWLALFLARQISSPISALVRAAEEVSKGNLTWRVDAKGIDELAQLVRGFNLMTSDLEASRAELDERRRFTEAILESIPTGIISIDSTGSVQRVNKALYTILPESKGHAASRLDDLFSPEDAAEIRYLMNRARRAGVATQQLEIRTTARTLHLAVTVAAVERGRNPGFVVVIEDTSDLLRAQKMAAWSEVARRVAHEIKNPLTPIALSAERILRQTNRAALPPAVDRLLRECTGTILEETASVKRLVDEFSEFSRLPTAEPVPCNINDVVTSGMSVFEGRLEGIEVSLDLSSDLPPVSADPEQLKRVVINLVDNAAEAMQDAPVKYLRVITRPGPADSVEIVFADSGCGITPDEKEKLFLPYFSTKARGTGLGLAIVSHILSEHQASIRVEDNKPCGAQFTVELPALLPEDQRPAVSAAALSV